MKKSTIAKLAAAGTAGAAAASVPYFHRQNTELRASQFVFRSPKVRCGLDGFRIVQVSDLHNREFGKDNCRLLALIEAQLPDLIVITGDLMDSYHTDLDKALAFARRAAGIAPCYFVTGNHEHRMTQERLADFLRGLERADVQLLRNRAVLIDETGRTVAEAGACKGTARIPAALAAARNGGAVGPGCGVTSERECRDRQCLSGVRDECNLPEANRSGTTQDRPAIVCFANTDEQCSSLQYNQSVDAPHCGNARNAAAGETFRLIGVDCQQGKTETLLKLMELRDPEELNILLSHKPHYAEYYRKAGVDLALTGHAHGGQWRFPLIGGLFAPGQGILPKYTSGMYRLGPAAAKRAASGAAEGTVLCVSRGLGNSSFPLRIRNKPELVTLTLRREEICSEEEQVISNK